MQILAVRPVDKPNHEPIEWLIVERTEVYERDPRDRSIFKASIRLSYHRIVEKYSHDGGGGTFDASYSHLDQSVSLTSSTMSSGGVFVDPPDLRGLHIGTYLMNEIVQWVQQWPKAAVRSVELLSGQADEDNKDRRNRFYEQFGLVFDYADSERRAGSSKPTTAEELRLVDVWQENITERPVMEYLADLLYAHQKTTWDLKARDAACRNLITEQRRAERHPVRWAAMTLYYRFSSTVVIFSVAAAFLCIAWLRLKGN